MGVLVGYLPWTIEDPGTRAVLKIFERQAWTCSGSAYLFTCRIHAQIIHHIDTVIVGSPRTEACIGVRGLRLIGYSSHEGAVQCDG